MRLNAMPKIMTARQINTIEKSKSLMDAFKAWLDEHYPLVLPKSPLGKAIAYCLNHRQGLLNDGRLEIDNNLTDP